MSEGLRARIFRIFMGETIKTHTLVKNSAGPIHPASQERLACPQFVFVLRQGRVAYHYNYYYNYKITKTTANTSNIDAAIILCGYYSCYHVRYYSYHDYNHRVGLGGIVVGEGLRLKTYKGNLASSVQSFTGYVYYDTVFLIMITILINIR